eukprot:CAMPEP_0175862648 /NCGR_PEP_ID=MMETSP0107_2-20121207/32062_1 /TAXON_ID=195067 ORGANISM="Goniomonas pacifica, Strain CCMP1869" /NCGR_SAMPLE_ID=MMETSP0107_2 /ASSEMBLY_ACC=CAM_ASM_000203 /LENGTH=30 /DNA_ID= /DNA_START= /DNA_END= /DNA_ORIENTATION=
MNPGGELWLHTGSPMKADPPASPASTRRRA